MLQTEYRRCLVAPECLPEYKRKEKVEQHISQREYTPFKGLSTHDFVQNFFPPSLSFNRWGFLFLSHHFRSLIDATPTRDSDTPVQIPCIKCRSVCNEGYSSRLCCTRVRRARFEADRNNRPLPRGEDHPLCRADSRSSSRCFL